MEHTASPGYAYGQLQRATRTALSAKDRATRQRAQAKASRWQDVLTGMADGSLRIGSRTPVADTPAWVTLEVAHGGFATGRFLAEVPLSPAEAALGTDGPGTTDRERLNLWYLTDPGLDTLRAMLASESYRIEVPEDAALPTVAWLLDHGHAEAALDLVAELRPHLHRLRLAPLPGAAPRPAGALVRLSTVGEVRESLRSASTPTAIAAMLETLTVWHPLFDRLVALWCDTVEGDLPRLAETGVTGGWPCRTWPQDWAQRRAQWLADYASASARNSSSTSHTHPKSNFARLHRTLLACEHDSTELTGRDVGWIRRAWRTRSPSTANQARNRGRRCERYKPRSPRGPPTPNSRPRWPNSWTAIRPTAGSRQSSRSPRTHQHTWSPRSPARWKHRSRNWSRAT